MKAKRFSLTLTVPLAASVFVFISASLPANVINVRSPSFVDVSAGMSLARDGDTLVIPSGEATWPLPLLVTKAITFQGQTAVSGGYSEWMAAMSKVSPLTYVPPVTRRTIIHGAFQLTPGGNGLYRVSGISFLPPTGNNIVNIKAGVPNFRVDHCEFSNATNEHVWAFNDKGLVDHNVSLNSSQIFFHHKPLTWGGNSSSYLGDGSWAADTDAGDAHGDSAKAQNKVYVEDNFFRPAGTRGFTDGESGARFVARYNILFSSACENHGAEAAFNRSGRLHEIYHNQFYSREGISKGGATYWRGGTGFIFSNTLSRTGAKDTYGSIGNVVDYRFTISQNPQSWGPANGRNGWDLNSNGQVMRAIDQPGAGKDSAPLRGQRSHPTWPQQAVEPFYVWSNRLNGAQTDIGNGGYTFLKENHDYYNEKTSFNGTAGVGVGPLSSRPASGNEGVGYWATDQQQLYVRRQGSWIVYYRPYVYPHPLVSGTNPPPPTPTPTISPTPTPSATPAGTPNPPTNLRVVP